VLVKKDEIDEVIFIKGYKRKLTTLKGSAARRTIRSESSRAKYLGISSPKRSMMKDETSKIWSSFNEKKTDRNTALIEAKAILTILFPISIVEKKVCGLFIK
jgi:hypothetical protein